MNDLQAVLDRPLSGKEVAYIRSMQSYMMLESFEMEVMYSTRERLEEILRNIR